MKSGKFLKYFLFAVAGIMLAITVTYAVVNRLSPLELPIGIIVPLLVSLSVAVYVAVRKNGGPK